jgi:aryl-alcohol dehydrogenase-like predicted oxidoreductase
MEYNNMGCCGLKLSVLSFATWVKVDDQFDGKMARDLIHQAYDAGINYFDNADIYANGKAEEVMGAAISELQREPGNFK